MHLVISSVFLPESSVVSLQCLGCRSSAWTWKGFILCVIVYIMTNTVHNTHCEFFTPPIVRYDSCCDCRDSRLIFRSFFIQQRRCFRWPRHLTVYIKTDISEPVPANMSLGLWWPSLTTALIMQTSVSHMTVWQGLRYDRENDSIVHSVHETKMVSLCVGVFIFQALPRAPLFAKTKSVLTFFFFFFTFRPNIILAFLQTWRISVVITTNGSKYSYTKWSGSCQIHLM